jgi:hypothetical protein
MLANLKRTVAFLLAVGVLAVVSYPVSLAAEQDRAKNPRRQAKEQPGEGITLSGKLESVDTDKNTITVSTFSRAQGSSADKTYTLAKDAQILQDDKKAKLADLKKGARATLKLSEDRMTALSISVMGNTVQAPVKAVDAEKNAITITVETRQGKVDKTHQVAKDAKVTIDGKEASIKDLKEGGAVILTFAVDGSTVIQVRTPSRRN